MSRGLGPGSGSSRSHLRPPTGPRASGSRIASRPPRPRSSRCNRRPPRAGGGNRSGASSVAHSPRPTPSRILSRANLAALLILCRCTPYSAVGASFSGPLALVPIAVAPHGALAAPRIVGFAERPAVGDDGEVPSRPLIRQGPSLEGRPDRLVVCPANEVPSPGDASDVRVDGERRMTGGHREDDIGGLWAPPGEGHQFLSRAGCWQRPNPFEAIAAGVEEGSFDAAGSRGPLSRGTPLPHRPFHLPLPFC